MASKASAVLRRELESKTESQERRRRDIAKYEKLIADLVNEIADCEAECDDLRSAIAKLDR